MNCRLSKVAGMCADCERGVGIGLGRLDGVVGSDAGHDITEEEQR